MASIAKPTATNAIELSSNQNEEQKMTEKPSTEIAMSESQEDKGVQDVGAELIGEPNTEMMMASDKSDNRAHPGDDEFVENEVLEDEHRTFTLFPKFPPELRLRVWKYALPGPRYIEVQLIYDEDWEESEVESVKSWNYVCKDNVPVLFFVCRESRAEVVKRYQPLRPTEVGSEVVYYNASVDVLVFRYAKEVMLYEYGVWLDYLPSEFVATIKNMAWECQWCEIRPPSMQDDYLISAEDFFSQADINKLSGLETLEVSECMQRFYGKVTGFREVKEKSEHQEDRDFIIFEMTQPGESWDATREDLRPGWVAPKVKLGRFVLE
jgi:hypothetical protein